MAEKRIKGAVGLNGQVFRAGEEKALADAVKVAGIDEDPDWYEGTDAQNNEEIGGGGAVAGGGLAGVEFASDEAAEAAADAGLSAADLDGMEPSGAGGFTKADVTKAASKRSGA